LEKLNNEINETFFLQKQLDNLISHKIGGPKKISVTVGNFYTRITETLSGILDAPLFHVGINPVTFWNLLKALLIFLLSLFAAKMLLNWIINLAYTRKNIDRSLLYRINRLFYYFLLVVMALLALSSIGLDFSNFLLVAGALGVGLGFGLQSIFNNFVSGLIMLFETHLKVGDFVEVASGVRGEIREINVRNTIISTNDGVDVIVPNSEMISNRVVNWTLKHPYRRVTVPFFVAYGTDKDLVAEVIKEGALKVPETLIKPGFSDPSVLIARYGDWRLEFELHVWVNEKYNKLPGKTISDYLWMIDDTLKKHNIEVPYKHLDISLK
jgi:small-conductance mechanosensitive channel